MTLPRPSTEVERLALKSATRGAVALAGGGSRLAMVTRLQAPALSKAGSAGDGDHFLPIDVALDADREAGAPLIAAEMARLLGFGLTPLISETPGCGVASAVQAVAKEAGEVVPAALAALADGAISAAERAEVTREIDDALAALFRLRAAINGGAHG